MPNIPTDIEAFRECWNGERFFEAHETLEPRWIRQRDRGLQGLIQLAAALHHLQRANVRGARTMLQRAIPRLQDPSNAACVINQNEMATFAQSLLDSLARQSAQELIARRPRL